MQMTALLCAGMMVFCLLSCGCTSGPGSGPGVPATVSATVTGSPQPVLESPTAGTFILSVDSVVPGSTLPAGYTCTGEYQTPGVSWENAPNDTKSFVLILEDPDAPQGTFTHWLVYNIPPQVHSIDPAQPDGKTLSDGAQVGTNTAGSRGYYPPCPPPGKTHRYIFRVYAVDMIISQPTADRESIDWALTGHTLGSAQVVTTFGR